MDYALALATIVASLFTAYTAFRGQRVAHRMEKALADQGAALEIKIDKAREARARLSRYEEQAQELRRRLQDAVSDLQDLVNLAPTLSNHSMVERMADTLATYCTYQRYLDRDLSSGFPLQLVKPARAAKLQFCQVVLALPADPSQRARNDMKDRLQEELAQLVQHLEQFEAELPKLLQAPT